MVGNVPRTVAIVGNAPEMKDQARLIDGGDWVVRFNNAAGLGGCSGSRVTHLTLVNHGGQMREWLADPLFTQRPVVRGARTILFPFPVKDDALEEQGEDGRDWTVEARNTLASVVPTIGHLPRTAHNSARAWLAESKRPDAVPSTGFLVALHLVASLPRTTRISVHGYGFAGWNGHHWARERAWFEVMRDIGRITLHQLDPEQSATADV